MTKHKFTVTAARGMLPLLATELVEMGIKDTKQEQGNIRFIGTLEDAYRVCLWSRVAIRVLMPIAHFTAKTTDELYQGIHDLPWEDHIDAQDSTIAVDFNSFRSKIHHTQYGAQRVKDGIVDRFREQTNERPSVDLHQPDLRINVYLKNNQAIVSIDLSGESLHKRGYRVETTQAPLKEHLAAAILITAQWPRLAKLGWGLIDPMCGSGTILIEAAMMAADIAPGMNRDYFGFLYWKQHDEDIWKGLKAEAERRRHSGLARLPMISGGDMDARAVEAASANIAEMGLSERINIEQRELLDWPSQASSLPTSGLVVCNPPYGERMGNVSELHYLYESLGNIVSESLPAWRTTMITDNESLAQYTGLTVFDSTPFDNGPIPCQVVCFRAPRPVSSRAQVNNEVVEQQDSLVVEQQDSDVQPQQDLELSENAEMFANRLKKNLKHLSKWARKNKIECYRLYDADLPDYAVAIDLYGEHVHVQEYAPPKTIDATKAIQRLNDVMQIIPQVLNVPANKVALKLRKKQRGTQQYEAQASQKQRTKVTESGLSFWLNLTDYLDTGLFLDHRITRQMIAEKAQGQAFLNLFAYTGSATVYAAAAQAESTTTVDMSNTYLEWAQENMALNGLTAEKHRFIRANCLEWLETAQQAPEKYGLIFLDPPTFSNSTRMEGVFDIQRDHVSLIKMTAALLTKGGTLFFSTNRRDFKMDNKALSSLNITDISHATLPKDFERNPKIHYCWTISKA
ncbi:MAG: bifunctional 23S rRNA (guanine(2069)-N(7))-methyltransferase RlmK/23S rRNA (guanine(2445)-N(2))-methyltransferase RlmL [Gammaproteobacteria bacterium]|nr:MAG: bifunctional 23S rRNA (guanine(2069)-N(7))-methyltransferase RlmK/23S rRNA (guanine(2445)-N(2))-methyltransferase RlmL [Gammaproteobacteria bacterium]